MPLVFVYMLLMLRIDALVFAFCLIIKHEKIYSIGEWSSFYRALQVKLCRFIFLYQIRLDFLCYLISEMKFFFKKVCLNCYSILVMCNIVFVMDSCRVLEKNKKKCAKCSIFECFLKHIHSSKAHNRFSRCCVVLELLSRLEILFFLLIS